MSCDNVAICPVCLLRARKEHKRLQEDLKTEYGKLTQEQYEALQTRAAKKINEGDYLTLEEYEEFYITESLEFTAKYSCECDVCGLEHSFKHKETIVQKKITGVE